MLGSLRPTHMRPVTSAPLGSIGQSTPVPQEILDQITTDPIPESMRGVLQGQSPEAATGSVPELPRYGLVPPQISQDEYDAAIAAGEVDNNTALDSTVMQRLSEEQRYEDRNEQAWRLAAPQEAPDFSTPDQAMNSVGNAIGEIGEAYKAYRVGPGKTNSVEDHNLSEHANNFANSYFAPDSVGNTPWSRLMSNKSVADNVAQQAGLIDVNGNVNQQAVNSFGSVAALATTGVIDDIVKQRLVDQTEEGEKPFRYDASQFTVGKESKVKTPEEKQVYFDEMTGEVGARPQNQRLFNALLDNYANRYGKLFAQGNRQLTANKLNKEAAATFMLHDYLNGYIDFAKDKYGQYVPIATDKGEKLRKDSLHAATIWDIELRHANINEPLVLSQKNPLVANRHAGEFDKITRSKHLKDAAGLLNDFAKMMGGVGLTHDAIRYRMLTNMLDSIAPKDNGGTRQLKTLTMTMSGHVVPDEASFAPTGTSPVTLPGYNGDTFKIPFAYSDSPFSKSIADLSQEKVTEKVKELLAEGKKPKEIVEEIAKINVNKLTQIEKHISQYIPRNLGSNGYGGRSLSSVNRFFDTATDINAKNHSGTIRATIAFGAKFGIPGGLIDKSLNDVRANANKVYGNITGSATQVGDEIQRRLWALPTADRTLLGAIYQIGKVANDFGLISVPSDGTPHDFIKAVTPQVLRSMAGFGKSFEQWGATGIPLNNVSSISLPPKLSTLKDFFEKKEWGYRVANAIMASKIVDGMEKGGTVTLDAPIETDATQSNAFIISLTIGDVKTANILRAVIDGTSFLHDRETYRDLRNLVSSSLETDIDETLSGPDDEVKANALKTFFNAARDYHQKAFDKLYARGIVVAGLYGKTPLYMFTEVEDMLSKIGLSNELENVEKLYKNRKEMLEDITSVYATSMKKHLGNLQGWQKLVSSIASVKAALNGSSRIQAIGNVDVDLSSRYTTTANDEANTIAGLAGMPDALSNLPGLAEDLGADASIGRSIKEVKDQQERLVELNQSISDINDQLYRAFHAGDKFRKQLPVSLIQCLDAVMMAASYLYANKDNKSDAPLNMYDIHDAMITSPESTLLLHNAYNNIAPYIIAQNGVGMKDKNGIMDGGLLGRLYNSLDTDVKAAHDKIKRDGFANIGQEGYFKAMGGYFDRMYNSQYYIPVDVKKKRRSESEYDRFRKTYTKQVLDLAIHAGWLPPTNMNSHKRDNIKISLKAFEHLQSLVRYAEGFASPKEEHMFPELDKLVSEYNAVQKQNRSLAKTRGIRPIDAKENKQEEQTFFGFNSESRNLRLLKQFEEDSKRLVSLLNSNKNYITNFK